MDSKIKSEINPINILNNKDARKNIEERLKIYWKITGLPSAWISEILKLLYTNNRDVSLAISLVREKFPQLIKKESSYTLKMNKFRVRKVKNLAKRINNFVVGKSIADIGGRKEDFVDQILKIKKDINQAYVTDIKNSYDKYKNKKIKFSHQLSPIKTSFSKGEIDTIILSLVLHHLTNRDQESFIRHLSGLLKERGRIILIEDSFPEVVKDKSALTKNMIQFLDFEKDVKFGVLSFYDWFGNVIMRNRDDEVLSFTYKSSEDWINSFKNNGLKLVYSEFIGKPPKEMDIFPPKIILVFEK